MPQPSPQNAPPLDILIADDHPLIVEGLTSALGRLGIRVIAQTGAATAVAGLYSSTRPTVVVLDVRVGEGASGLDVAKELTATHPDAKIVFYTQFDDDESIKEAYQLGAKAFVPKNTAPGVLADALHQVASGRTFFLPEIAERLALMTVQKIPAPGSPSAVLDARELQVFKHIAMGHMNRAIADEMGLSAKTISAISQSVKEKLGYKRPADLTRLAVKHGLIKP